MDYIQTEGTIAFDADVTNNTITVQILADTIPEAGEAFQIELYEAIGEFLSIAPGMYFASNRLIWDVGICRFFKFDKLWKILSEGCCSRLNSFNNYPTLLN